MRKYLIAPSILSADFARLGDEVGAVITAGADLVHFDVMDNHYVPNLTFGPMVCAALRKYGVVAPIDVHLMCEPVDSLIIEFAKAGATYITFHPEASAHVDRSLRLIRDHGCNAGLALNPATAIDCLEYVWEKLDLILLMSVNPGFGGQRFIPSVLSKIRKIRNLIDSKTMGNNTPLLEVDGGITLANLEEVASFGADVFVAGSAIFNSNDSYDNTITQMKAILRTTCRAALTVNSKECM